MDNNITFRINPETKQQMSDICKDLGMSVSTAFNLFANAFVREGGIPFPVTIHTAQRYDTIPVSQMAKDADQILVQFADDYKRMAQ